jgi:hypothetical protein
VSYSCYSLDNCNQLAFMYIFIDGKTNDFVVLNPSAVETWQFTYNVVSFI